MILSLAVDGGMSESPYKFPNLLEGRHLGVTTVITQSFYGKTQQIRDSPSTKQVTYVPWSKVAILGMVIPPLIRILIMGI